MLTKPHSRARHLSLLCQELTKLLIEFWYQPCIIKRNLRTSEHFCLQPPNRLILLVYYNYGTTTTWHQLRLHLLNTCPLARFPYAPLGSFQPPCPLPCPPPPRRHYQSLRCGRRWQHDGQRRHGDVGDRQLVGDAPRQHGDVQLLPLHDCTRRNPMLIRNNPIYWDSIGPGFS